MASILQYNGVTLPFVKSSFSQEAVYSVDGVDVLYTKVNIKVDVILAACMLGEQPADWLASNRAALLARGGQLYFVMDGYYYDPATSNPLTDGGEEMVAAPKYAWNGSSFNFNSIADAKLGPKPIRFDVRQVAGNAFFGTYEIETYIPYCSGTPSIYLSNRWSTDVSIDDEYFLTRTIEGVLVINGQYWNSSTNDETDSNGLAISWMVDNDVIIPPCPARWKREDIKLLRSSDGLTINYSIVDKQLYAAMPRPCTKIDATYSETSGTKDIALLNVLICEMNITVHGEPNAQYNPQGDPQVPASWNADYNKYNLMEIMFQVIAARIPAVFLTTANTVAVPSNFNGVELVQYFQISEEVFKPIIKCTIKTLKSRQQASTAVVNAYGAPLGWSSGAFQWTNIASTIPITDILDDISRTPTNQNNYGLWLITSNILGSGNLPLGPCSAEDYRSLGDASSNITIYAGNTSDYEVSLACTVLGSPVVNTPWATTTATYYGSANYRNPFTEYTFDIQNITEQHMFQLPIMYDTGGWASGGNNPTGSTCVFVQTAAPTTKRVVNWKASRLGNWPMSPNPQNAAVLQSSDSPNTGPNAVLSYHISYQDSELLPDGVTRRYSVGGVYEIGLGSRLQWDAGGSNVLPVAVNPITNDSWGVNSENNFQNYNTYPVSSFVPGIVGYGNNIPGNLT